MKRNSEIVSLWLQGKKGKNGHMRTNGNDLFSYDLLIGKTKNKTKYYLSFANSKTTKAHIKIVMQTGNAIPVYPYKNYNASYYHFYQFPPEYEPEVFEQMRF